METTLEQAKTKWCPLSFAGQRTGDWIPCAGNHCMAFTPAGHHIEYDEHNRAHRTPVFVCGLVAREEK